MIETSSSAAHEDLERAAIQFRLTRPPGMPFAVSDEATVSPADGNVSVSFSAHAAQEPGSDRARQLLERMLERCRREVAKHPKSASTRLTLGLALLNQNLIDESIEVFRQVLEEDASNVRALQNLARGYFSKGEYQKCEEVLQEARRIAPNELTPVVGLATVARAQGQLERSLELLRVGAAVDPDSAVANYEAGLTLIGQQRVNDAINRLRAAARSDSRSPAVFHALAVAYEANRSSRRAKQSLATALRLDPSRPESVHSVARSLLKEGQAKPASVLLTEFLRDRTDLTALELLSQAQFELGRYSAARMSLVRLVRDARRQIPHCNDLLSRSLNNLGVCSVKLGDEKASESLFLESIALAPNQSTHPYHNLSGYYARARRFNESVRILSRCADQFPDDGKAAALLALALADAGQASVAIAGLKTFLETHTDSAEPFAVIGALIAEELGDFESALEWLYRGRDLFHTNSRLTNNLAYVLLLSGDVAAAAEVIESMDDSKFDAGDRPMWTATRGLLAIKRGDLAEGERIYRQAQTIAVDAGNRSLGQTVIQKMHLELATALVGKNQHALAERHVLAGLRIQGKEGFRRRLLRLKEELGRS